MCSKAGYQFVPVDMRWGITSEMSSSAFTIEICLREMDRSDMIVGFFGQVVKNVQQGSLLGSLDTCEPMTRIARGRRVHWEVCVGVRREHPRRPRGILWGERRTTAEGTGRNGGLKTTIFSPYPLFLSALWLAWERRTLTEEFRRGCGEVSLAGQTPGQVRHRAGVPSRPPEPPRAEGCLFLFQRQGRCPVATIPAHALCTNGCAWCVIEW